MKNVFIAFLTLLIVLVRTGADPGKGFDCENAKQSLLPCVDFLKGEDGGSPSSACCDGLNAVKSLASTKEARREACECLKEALSRVPNIKEDLAASLPKQCGINVSFKIGKDINCDDIP